MDRRWLSLLSEILEDPRFEETIVYVGPEELLEGIVGFSMHQNLLAIGMIPRNPAIESLHTQQTGRHVHVALEGLADAENMGMILRNCAAFGVRSLIVGADSSSPWLRRSVRVSLGNVFSIRIHQTEDLLSTLETCRVELGWRLIATTPRGGHPTIGTQQSEGAEHLCLLFGSEATGLTEQALELCHDRFSIPMHGGVDSINVANAVAVAMHEATRGIQF
jgi:tRNA G18 (ribose-2'-O)-methylase SpoU